MHILVIDDDAGIRDMLKTALVARGHEVTALSDPTEFPFLNKETCPCPENSPCADVFLADNVMPHLEGIDFFKELKSRGCRPLIEGNVAIMSGYLTIHYMSELNDLGINYFRKPFNLNDIYVWIDHCQERIEGSLKIPAAT